jgi:hypothetical protein
MNIILSLYAIKAIQSHDLIDGYKVNQFAAAALVCRSIAGVWQANGRWIVLSAKPVLLATSLAIDRQNHAETPKI